MTSYNWGQNDTASSIASALAAQINQVVTNSSGVKALTATSNGGSITLTSTQAGAAYAWPVSTTVADTSGGLFPASFSASATAMTGFAGEPGANGNGTFTQYVYAPSGAKIATVQNGALVQAVIPLPGGSSAVYNSGGFAYFRHRDWLGSSRLATTWTHTVYSKEAYAPFGETYNEAGTPDRSFTGQDQTTSNGNSVYDYLFRKYDPVAGRWLSPDPSGWNAVRADDPQSLNRYAYVENNPMAAVDPDGLDACAYVNSDGTASISNGAGGGAVDCNGDGIYITTTSLVTAIGVDGNGDLSVYGAKGSLYNPDGTAYDVSQSITVTPDGDGSYTGFAFIYSPGIQYYTQAVVAPNNGPTPIDKANATLRQCQAQAAAAAQPYMNDVKMPSANELVGTGVLATAASIFTKGNPIAIGISAASVLRKQIGGLINGLIAHNAEFAGCSISNGVNPIAFTGSF